MVLGEVELTTAQYAESENYSLWANFSHERNVVLENVDEIEDYFSNNASFSNDTPPCRFIDSPMNIAQIAVFAVIFCLSVIGNCLVIVTIAQNRQLRSVTNIFLQSLAISDLLLSVICMPPTLTAMLFKCFLWGPFMCSIIFYLQPVSVTASAYTLVVIALERYNAICRPLHSRHWKTKSHAIKMILIVWGIAFLCSLPNLAMYKMVELQPGQYNCRMVWPKELLSLKRFYNLFMVLAFLVVPLTLMIGLYACVIYTLWTGIKSETSNELSSPSEEEAASLRLHSTGESSGYGSSITRRVIVSKPAVALRRFGDSVRSSAAVQSFRRKATGRYHHKQRGSDCAESPLDPKRLSPPRSLPVTGSHGAQHENHDRHSSDAARSTNGSLTNAMTSSGCGAPILRSTHSAKNLQAKKRVIIMLFVIVLEFAVCWTPLYVFMLLSEFKSVIFHWGVYAVLVTLSYISSCTNPITYCFLNMKFRQAFLLAFGCRFLVKNAPQFYNSPSVYMHNQHYQQSRRLPQMQHQRPSAQKHPFPADSQIRKQSRNCSKIDGTGVQFQESAPHIPLVRFRTPSETADGRNGTECKRTEDNNWTPEIHKNYTANGKIEDDHPPNGYTILDNNLDMGDKLTSV